MKDYFRWRANPAVDKAEAADTVKSLPYIRLEAYPVELLTQGEYDKTYGIYTGHVPWYPQPPASYDSTALDAFIKDARSRGKTIVFLGRGGLAPKSRENVTVLCAHLLEGGTTAIIATLPPFGPMVEKYVTADCYVVASGSHNHSDLFNKVDVIIHHGGAGTTLTAFKCGVPQIIVPRDSPLQLQQGTKVASFRCGVVLRPRLDLTGDLADIVQGLAEVLRLYPWYKKNCEEWKEKLKTAEGKDGSETTVHAVKKLVLGAAALKDAGEWPGWMDYLMQNAMRMAGVVPSAQMAAQCKQQ